MIKIKDFRINEEQIFAYYADNNISYDSPVIIIDMKDKIQYRIFCSTKNEVNLYIDRLDSYFDVDEIKIDEENFIN